MKDFLAVVMILLVIAVVIAFGVGISFLAYWIVLKAGAPKWIAAIVGVSVFFIGSFTARTSKHY